jgi:hypothetical protein
MTIREFAHLGNPALLRRIEAEAANDCRSTATLIALIAEVDRRRLYLPEGFPSMFAYCVHKLHLSPAAALKRIDVARAARKCEAILDAVAEGRLHLTGVLLLAPHLTPENAGELLAAATHKTRSEIERLLAARFPRPDLPTRVQAITPPLTLGTAAAPGDVQERSKSLAPGRVDSPAPRPKVTPLSAQTFALQVTIGASSHDKLRYAQALLGHAVPSGEIAAVLDRALDALIEQLEKRKFGASSRPRPSGRSSANPRHIPAGVKQGPATAASASAAAAVPSSGPSSQPALEPSDDLQSALRTLGYRKHEVRRAVALCAAFPGASLEAQVRLALRHLMPPHRRVAASPATAA